MNREDLVRDVVFTSGRYACEAVLGGTVHPLLELEFDGNDEAQGRRLPRVHPANLAEPLRSRVANALVRAGAAHPGLRPADLAMLHAAARRDRHIELFVDINALTQGLISQIARSLRGHVARIVVSSSTIDVLHEYQSFARRHHDGSGRILEAWELARGLRALCELHPPLHVHQLAPGAARYFRRPRAEAASESKNAPSSEHREEATYIAEDRQMVGAFWDYLSTDAPRIPIFLVTSDLSLAHVCSAERVPFVFARAPREDSAILAAPSLWFDPYALEFRFWLAQTLLWELVSVLGTLNVRRVGGTDDPTESFSLTYDPRAHAPGHPEGVTRGLTVTPTPPATPRAGGAPKAARATVATDRTLKLSLTSIVPVLPTHPTQRRPISAFDPRDADSLRQLRQIGEATQLYREESEHIVAGPALTVLLKALEDLDYVAVNRIFRKVPGYDRAVQEAAEQGVFASGRKGGSSTGWAVTLGAAYKLQGEVRFGLTDVSDESFERMVVRVHAELAVGERAVPMFRVLDRVCSELRISPIRFEALLQRGVGQRGLRDFEAQRATSTGRLPAHDVLVLPTTSASSSYIRRFVPGDGVTIGGKLVGSLVRRAGSG